MMTSPIILDLEGTAITPEEKEILQHPLVGGLILFSRNYISPQQITDICRLARQCRKQPLLIAVDHEGGRVQRFKQGFTAIPPMGELGALYEKNSEKALKAAESFGALIAKELLAVGVDFSFTPVLDLDRQRNSVIGDRAFHQQPDVVIALATALIKGLHDNGMASCGKHFPGHGAVTQDSHHALPVDERSLPEIYAEDLKPFIALIQAGIRSMMPAHIIFSAVDQNPVGFSSIWLQNILRQQLQFSGKIFSDDLNMAGAEFAGDYPARARAALQAGCDMVLICNNRAGAISILDRLSHDPSKEEH